MFGKIICYTSLFVKEIKDRKNDNSDISKAIYYTLVHPITV